MARGGFSGCERTPTRSGTVFCRTAGSPGAPDVVLVHGLGVSSRYWGPLAGALAADARVAAPDLPGFGRSRGPRRALDVPGLAAALAEWLTRTGRTGAVLVGHSVGCQVVVELAHRRAAPGGPLLLAGPTMDAGARSALRQSLRLLADVPREPPALLPVVAADYLACGVLRYAATLRHALAHPMEQRLAALSRRGVVLRGGRDPVAGAAWSQQVADALVGGRLVEVPGHGHAVVSSAPQPVAAVVRSLLETPAPPG